jgi:hypothetical protein
MLPNFNSVKQIKIVPVLLKENETILAFNKWVIGIIDSFMDKQLI